MEEKLKKLIPTLVIAGILIAGYFVAAKTQNWWPFEIIEKQQETNTQVNSSLGEVERRKTYRNEEFGFEFKYPNNFKLQSSVDDQSSLIKGYFPFLKGKESILVGTSMEDIKTRYPNTDLTKAIFAVLLSKNSECERIKNLNASGSIINGELFFEEKSGDVGLGNQRSESRFSVIKNSNCFILVQQIDTAGYGAIEGIEKVNITSVSSDLHQILSTFRFTK